MIVQLSVVAEVIESLVEGPEPPILGVILIAECWSRVDSDGIGSIARGTGLALDMERCSCASVCLG
jgi:hypothetical protein